MTSVLNCLVLKTQLVALLTVDTEGVALGIQTYHHYHTRSHGAYEGKVHATCLMHFLGKNAHTTFICGMLLYWDSFDAVGWKAVEPVRNCFHKFQKFFLEALE